MPLFYELVDCMDTWLLECLGRLGCLVVGNSGFVVLDVLEMGPTG